MGIKILVDSSSDISAKEAERLGVEMLPIPITFGDVEFEDGVSINTQEFYDKLTSSPTLPKTSQINGFRFEEAFERIVNGGDEVVAIVLSSKLSSTCTNAKQSAEKFAGKVFVVDSLSATAGIRVLVDYALNLVKEGKTAQEIYELLEDKKNKVEVVAMVDTLKYLKKGGRISPLIAFAGELMGIKPLVSIVEGKVEVIGKVVGGKKAIMQIDKEIENRGGINIDMPFYVIYSGNDQSKADDYINTHAQMWGVDANKIYKNCIGATIGTHIGPGAIGVIFFAK